ncbi:TIGR03364 family FAD-dependent oxidoreductase [Acidicapsa ligni]|uniref:TIGR03364 family FAD-dependent oxidoreductase n=1 Tax=Acidicapsa ligni TaxID=542300 RepID=UPI0021DFE694|nr:TIGR03364 family FAD-dependent oxidoreductase [Acidicapsa ligni]
MSEQSADVIIIGAGIIGLAHAYLAAKSGKRVTVFERNRVAAGASIANFGMLWPIGQTAGTMFNLAMESRDIWIDLLQASGIPYKNTGSLHAATRPDEARVAQEFAELAPAHGYECAWLNRIQALERSSALNKDTVMGALWSATEMMVDPREVLRRIPEFLAERYNVQFFWGSPVFAVDHPKVHTPNGVWNAEQIIICSGSDFESLYPEFFNQSGLTRCKLQMLRTRPQPAGWELGPALAGGLTFRFYPSFKICDSLSDLRNRIARESPEFDLFGIHTMVSETSSGELTLGDSHEYGLSPSPFDREEIDRLILEHLRSFVQVPDLSIAERWHGVYSKHLEKPYIRFRPEEGVEVVTGLGGAGMTLSFGVAAETFKLQNNGRHKA